jgi:preprotein translocase subunit YajC
MLNLISNAYAQGAPAQNANPIMQLIPIALIFVVFYFFMIRPQAKKIKEEQAFINSLEKGSEVFTKSGIIGTIVGLTDKIATLEISDGVKLKVLRSQIAGLATKLFETEKK